MLVSGIQESDSVIHICVSSLSKITFPFRLLHNIEQRCYIGDSDGKESACNVGNLGSIPELGGSPGEGNGNPLQYSCLENPMDIGDWWASVHGVARSRTRLSD